MRRATFRQVDLTRAIRAAKNAGMDVGACEIMPDGRIVIRESTKARPVDDAFGAWKAKREGRVEGRS
ncbi:hypothetical protein SAMN05421763_1038 [[Luteovulum] sphaeroides subsp. megalophilum]|uniref:hypothetical protein n=1 Tax=Cereibacter sphaeroides TaxID=1063 RepID=UPI000B746667|nr:hypothetical protein [Cereibacter sphaeroides]SNS80458.1 hypothetical protein SAMN05421763_1038 [[Luteovulum] sphaeroides subsp. megalophilum]